jgi:hypothetical protein
MDRMGADPSGRAFGRGDGNDPAATAMGALFAAAATDPVLGRALARLMNLLTLPADLMADPAVRARAAEVMADPDAYPPPTQDGPTRADLLESLAASPAA